MNIQEAYNKGLDDAENAVISILTNVLNSEESESFANPKMEELRKQFISKLSRNSRPELSIVWEPGTECELDNVIIVLTAMLMGDKVSFDFKNPQLMKVLTSFKIMNDKFHRLSRQQGNLGKAFKKLIAEQIELLTSEN